MNFFIDELNKLLPPELTEQKKGRLREGLSQFHSSCITNDKFYSEFYLNINHPYFLQGDLIKEIRFSVFNKEKREYEKLYYDALLISNTCDVDEANIRNITKKPVFAKLIPCEVFIESLNEIDIENSAHILTQIKNQQFSNVIYFPQNKNGADYIAYFDDLSVLELEELSALKSEIEENRIESLDYFGYYLLIFKLSFHFCRLPEDTHR